jgi:hypothetical protein
MTLTTGSNGQLSIGSSISAGNQSVLLGPGAGGTGLGSTSIGKYAGGFTTGTDNVAIGQDAGMSVTTGNENIMIGSHTGRAAGGVTTNKTGDNNIGIGACSASEALSSPSTSQTFQALTSGARNVALGGASATNMTTGNNNLCLGHGAGQNITTGDHNICIKAPAPSASGDTQLAIGGWLTGDSSYNITVTGNVTAYSDERLKTQIQTLDGKKVLEMRGVEFIKDGVKGSGVIAQELEKIAPELVQTAVDEMGTKSVAYGNITGYLIEAIKEQQSEIDELKDLVKQLLEK